MRKLLMVLSFLALPFLAACEDDATIASRNLSKAADNFEVVRNIVFYNVWTDTEVATVIGVNDGDEIIVRSGKCVSTVRILGIKAFNLC